MANKGQAIVFDLMILIILLLLTFMFVTHKVNNSNTEMLEKLEEREKLKWKYLSIINSAVNNSTVLENEMVSLCLGKDVAKEDKEVIEKAFNGSDYYYIIKFGKNVYTNYNTTCVTSENAFVFTDKIMTPCEKNMSIYFGVWKKGEKVVPCEVT